MSLLAGVDVGTTGARCTLFDLQGTVVASAYREYATQFPRPGWAEQDGDGLIAAAMDVCGEALADPAVTASEIRAVGFSSQRVVTGAVDRDGKLLRPLISWQDTRALEQLADIAAVVDGARFARLTGLPLIPQLLLANLLWMRKHQPELAERTAKLTQQQDLLLQAFGADGYFTDLPDVAFSGVWNVVEQRWDAGLMQAFGVSPNLFGTPTRPGTRVGAVTASVAARTGLAPGTPICVGAGDQSCALIGMGSVAPGSATVTLGTAGLAILLVNQPIADLGGLVLIRHPVEGVWDVEGVSFAAAGAYRWFRDVVGTLEVERASSTGADAYVLLDQLAAQAQPGSRGLLFLPFLSTAASPHWNTAARGAFLGLSMAHGRAELTRSVMEGVTLEVRDMMRVWQERGLAANSLRIGGGATRSDLWNQIQADVYGMPVQLPKVAESTVLGAAILGGVGVGEFASVEEGVDAMVDVAAEIEPIAANHRIYTELYEAYRAAYSGLNDGAFAALAALQQSDTA